MPHVQEFNRESRDIEKIDGQLLPEPFFGRRDAPLVILLLNPGIGSDDRKHHEQKNFKEMLLADLRSSDPATHFHLSDRTAGPGHRWWLRACKELIEDLGIDRVMRGILSVEFSPYHSEVFAHAHVRLPSQEYGFELVRQAIDRRAHIVCMRGLRLWTGAIPELGRYENRVDPKNNRSAALTRGNLEKYDLVRDVLKNAE